MNILRQIKTRLATILAAVVTAGAALTLGASCDLLKQAQGTYNMVNCKYDFRSLSGVSVAGINLSNGISLLEAPRILSLLSGNTASIPVACTVNLNVQNPNRTDAIMNGLDYVLSVDGIDFTSGTVTQQLSVAPGATGVLPLSMAFDVAALLRGESRDAAIGIVRNLAGMSGLGSGATGEPSKVTLNIRPSFNVAGNRIVSPAFIPINFSFGGK